MDGKNHSAKTIRLALPDLVYPNAAHHSKFTVPRASHNNVGSHGSEWHSIDASRIETKNVWRNLPKIWTLTEISNKD